ncbi:hypothetical protein Nit79A3_2327 [Nitrosomonas sp. Is79A3]|jgi:hypothetical protein
MITFINIAFGIVLLLLLSFISSLISIWLKRSSNQIMADGEIPDTAEGGFLVMRGLAKYQNGKTKGQKRPAGFPL